MEIPPDMAITVLDKVDIEVMRIHSGMKNNNLKKLEQIDMVLFLWTSSSSNCKKLQKLQKV